MHTCNRKTHGPRFAFLIALSATAIGVLPLSGNQAQTTAWRISIGQVASVVGAMSVGLIPTVFSINDGLPTCAPCDPATLPGIDRWAASTEKTEWGVASWVAEFGLAGGTWYELYKLSNGNADVAVSFAILEAQLARYDELPDTVDALDAWLRRVPENAADQSGKFVREDGRVVFNFGKHKGKPLAEVAAAAPDYLKWILGSDFPDDAKQVVRDALDGQAAS